MATTKPRPVPRTALTRQEAAASLGVSFATFERYVQPDLRLTKVGKRKLVPLPELERWLESNAQRGNLSDD